MTEVAPGPILVIGLGCRQGCSAVHLIALIEQSLDKAGLALSAISALASIETKQHEPGLLQVAAQLNFRLEVFSAEQLAPFSSRLSHHSTIAFEHTGCYGVAESAALALAEQLGDGPASVLITRQKSSAATFALACARQKPR
ncbi:cobalamin biosynthesis protein [Pseudomonas helleri]|uniref:Cobalamin biosynthesis protein CobE n=1 Tax=Pseudomonas helleri TaxID=1608996 RepID=A0A6A7YVE7_9PSED|nr:cobalamin biosynthesis protein [Pseudomonas helleri]MQT25714.1 cobalamin biosynthesis protein CobE [Pseudomonas helleri]MQT80748.1 cobalamin biosynthesis protein CobE [Pseudomonas helleri]MQU16965.1 cobalamin biosynthesis protein CobE [Pseudomonas helleri]MQU26901.1 cobalamin biosynthesis protein CobE [Pseudomonas helleri]